MNDGPENLRNGHGSTSGFEVVDDRFFLVVAPHARLESLCTGVATWSEGPVYLPDEDTIVWSDIPNNRMLRYGPLSRPGRHLAVFRGDAEFTNGNTLDHSGRIVSCSHGKRAIERTEGDGTVVVLVDRYEGKRLNSPNDLVVATDGSIWFTDPPYGILSDHEGHKADSEIGACYVYRFDPSTDDLRAVVADMEHPNGLAFSPDESVLYVADTSAAVADDGRGNHHIRAYDVAGARCNNGRLFTEIDRGVADGFCVDRNGNVLTSSLDAIMVFASDATLLGRITVPEKVSNCCWGGPGRQRLFITATSSLYAIDTLTGAP